ncbi:hypothetical protein C2E23DRAFT_874858 [Lenzites betulinus]|nr:hypothetical protein C2E23DRAFT_874858 [Lenzites betulinus]
MSSVSEAAISGDNEITTRKRPITEVISETFHPFDHHSKVVGPFDDETKRDAEFVEKLNVMLLELILDFHAWSAARPMYESDKNADTLEKAVRTLRDAEKDQGRSYPSPSSRAMPASGFVGRRTAHTPRLPHILTYCPSVEQTRQRLNEFITRIKLALAALTGLGP